MDIIKLKAVLEIFFLNHDSKRGIPALVAVKELLTFLEEEGLIIVESEPLNFIIENANTLLK